MRIDENKNLITLEQDILRIWSEHGWLVVQEIVRSEDKGETFTWRIKAKPIREGVVPSFKSEALGTK